MFAAPVAIAALAGGMLVISLFPARVSKQPGAVTAEIRDMQGNPLTLPGIPRRTMIFPPMLGHYVTVDGTDAHVSAIARYLREEARESLLGKLFPALRYEEEAISQGVMPFGVEQVMLEQPDAVFTWSWFAADFENIGYPGLAKIEFDESAGLENTYRFLGAVTGQQQRVSDILENYQAQLKQLHSRIPHRKSRPSIVVMNPWNLYLWGKNFLQFNRDIRALGARNAAESLDTRMNELSVEELSILDPDCIFLPASGSRQYSPEGIYSDPRLSAIRAVRHRRVYRFPNGAARMEGPVENAILLQWMAEIIYPEMTPSAPLRTRIREAYREVYGYDMSAADIDEMLRIRQNGVSAGYERFAERQ